MIFIALHRKDGTEEGVQPMHISRYWKTGPDDQPLLTIHFLNDTQVEYRETAEQMIELIRAAPPVTKYV